jgi:hypothetical protein
MTKHTTTKKRKRSKCQSCGRRIREENLYIVKGPTRRYKQWLQHNEEVRQSGSGAELCWACWKESAYGEETSNRNQPDQMMEC